MFMWPLYSKNSQISNTLTFIFFITDEKKRNKDEKVKNGQDIYIAEEKIQEEGQNMFFQ